jgi:hypothetical protein
VKSDSEARWGAAKQRQSEAGRELGVQSGAAKSGNKQAKWGVKSVNEDRASAFKIGGVASAGCSMIKMPKTKYIAWEM